MINLFTFVQMRGFTTYKRSETNQLNLQIPDELKGIELQIIILPAKKSKEYAEIEFFTDDELSRLPAMQPGASLEETEDYTKW